VLCFINYYMFRFVAVTVTPHFVLSNFHLHAVVITPVVQGLVE
jgi:hypothetical protein